MNWVNKHKLLAIEAVKYNSQPCLEINNLWQALHLTFNMAQHCFIDEEVLNELELFTKSTWNLFLEEEFTSALTKYNNSFTHGPNKLVWRHLKHILKDSMLWNDLDTDNFSFLLFNFSDFILILFSFSF